MTDQDKKYYVGIDVSKTILDVFILPCNKHMQFKNNSKDIQKLIEKLKSFFQVSIVMEATGGYEKLVAQSLKNSEYGVSVVNPRRIRDFAKALGKLAKTDKIDCQTIALFAEKMQPNKNVVCDIIQDNLAENNTRRRQLIDMITMEKNRLDKAGHELKKSIKRVLKTLENELHTINEIQEKLIQNDTQSAKRSQLLQSIKGVGNIVASDIISDLPELGSISSKKITALAGLAPYYRDSGTIKGRHPSGEEELLYAVHSIMATLVAIRHNSQIKSFYERLCNAGKIKKVAIVACMRKLLIIMNAMIKNHQPWRPAVNEV